MEEDIFQHGNIMHVHRTHKESKSERHHDAYMIHILVACLGVQLR